MRYTSAKELRPVVESTADYEAIERRIIAVFRELLYKPLLKSFSLTRAALQNAKKSALIEALESGKVWVEVGRPYKAQTEQTAFYGEFNAEISKELKAMGAKWNKATSSWRLFMAQTTPEMHAAFQAATSQSIQRFQDAAKALRQNLPEFIAGEIKVSHFFSSALLKVDKELRGTVKDVAIPPVLSEETARRIAAEWQHNLEKWVKDFADEEVEKLREGIKKSALKGNRFESSVATIRRSFGVTEKKAKFLARQETGLLMAKFKESRYTESGIHEYKWRCSAGSAKHPVRPSHKVLDGKVFRWDAPPITTAPDEPPRRNNPGEDFNCRCVAIPIVKF